MEANKILEWWTETQKVQQQQQMQALQQLLSQFQERQEQMARGTPVTVPGTAGGPGGGEGVGTQLPIRLTKLGPDDDPEAFLVTFERVATAAKWPPEHWATLLAPYLSGPAQLAYRGMSANDALCYFKVKEAILDQLGVTPETHRRRVRGAKYDPRERPRAVAQRVKEAGMRWLEPEAKTGVQVADLVILEQYVRILPAEGQQWVRRHLPETPDEAVTLMEHYLAAEGPVGKEATGTPREPRRSETGTAKPAGAQHTGGGSGSSLGPLPTRRLAPRWSRPGGEVRMDRATETGPGTPLPKGAPKVVCYQCSQEGHYKRDCTLMDCTFGQRRTGGTDRRTASVAQVIRRLWVNGNPVEAILDSGCGQTIVRKDVIYPVRARGAPIALRCVHGDIHYYPTTRVRIGDGEVERNCIVAIGPRLAYPLLLGRDWPGLKRLLGQWDRGRNPGQEPEAGQGTLVAQGEQEGEEASPGVAPAAETSGQTRLDVEEGDFLTQQREDPTLRAAWEQVRTTGETPGEDPPKQPEGAPVRVVGTPFERVALDLVGPLEKSGRGHSYILVIVDYATRCPEAVALKRATAPAIAEALVKLFSWVGLPRELLTDQGTNLTSKVMTELCRTLQIRKLRTSVYHPQTDGLVERFNRTLKGMLRKFAQDDPREWDKLLPALMFAVREKWHPREVLLIEPRDTDIELGPWGEPEVKIEGVRIGEELPGPKQEQLHHLLDQFRPVLTSRPGQTTLVQHEIETEPGRVVRDNMRPLPRKLWGTVKEELQAMLEWGVIQESRSEWRSPIVLVPKADGSTRFCIDFRKVNAISRFDAYPMPRIDELLGRLGRATYLSTLDLTKGYWQIPLSPEAQAKTAFATPFGLYQFRNMPFGLHGAAATFQRLMNQVLREHQDYAAAYIDDIVIFSESWEEHLGHITNVLGALRKAGLTANPKKCQFGRAEVSYLGYTVGRGKLKPLVDKVQAVRDHPVPTTKRKVRQFLGLAGYYRRFIPNFSSLAAPLTDLTRKGQPERVRWTPTCEGAFRELKDRLVSAPVLAQPDFNKPFTLQTDASEVGLGAVLTQEEGGEEHPILYLSRKLFPRERGYATVEKEALALKWAIDSLRYFLVGDEFTVVTDHAPLQWMQQMKDTNPRILRWYLSLQPYQFRVIHRPGTNNGNADWLSRVAESSETETASGAPDLRGKACGGVAPPLPGVAGTPRRGGEDSTPGTAQPAACGFSAGKPAPRPGDEPGPAGYVAAIFDEDASEDNEEWLHSDLLIIEEAT
nr:uncharacterized protein LOC112544063 [Pelodiscus sinensis]|eukprot:XP_025035341.1 uncharacterized protein LOC112544063 [Pelodiscus sinensis]